MKEWSTTMEHEPVLQRALGILSGRGIARLEQAGLVVVDKSEYERLVARCTELEQENERLRAAMEAMKL